MKHVVLSKFVHFQAAALGEAVAAMAHSEGDSKLMERAVSRGSSSTGKAKIDSKSPPPPTSMAPPSSSPQKGAAEGEADYSYPAHTFAEYSCPRFFQFQCSFP
jgi:hypothetical protein